MKQLFNVLTAVLGLWTASPLVASPTGAYTVYPGVDAAVWNARGNLKSLAVTGATLRFELAGSDGYSGVIPVRVEAVDFRYLQIRFRTDRPGNNQCNIYFATADRPELNDANSLVASFYGDTGFQTVTMNLAEVRGWQGVITGLRIGFSGGAGQIYEISHIALTAQENLLPLEQTAADIAVGANFSTGKIYTLLPNREYAFAADCSGAGRFRGSLDFYDENRRRIGQQELTSDRDAIRVNFSIPETATAIDIHGVAEAGPVALRNLTLTPTGRSLGGWEAEWITYPGREQAAGTFWFTTSFQLDRLPEDVRLQFTADDRATWYVNGKTVFDRAHFWQHPIVTDVVAPLRIGRNVVNVRLVNHGDWGALLGKLRLFFADGTRKDIVTDTADWHVTATEPAAFGDAVELPGMVPPVSLGVPPVSPWGGIPYAEPERRTQLRLDEFQAEPVPETGVLRVTLQVTVETLVQPMDQFEVLISREGYPIARHAAKLSQPLNRVGDSTRLARIELPLDTLRLPPGNYEISLDANRYRLSNAPDNRCGAFELPPIVPAANAVAEVVTVDGKRRPRVNGEPVYFNSYIGAFYDQRRFAAPFFDRGIDSALTFDGSQARGACNNAWIGDSRYDFERITPQIERLVSIRPDLKLIVGIGVDAPAWWAAEHPDELIRFAGSDHPEQLSSPASQLLRRESGEALRATIRYWENSRFASNIVGYRFLSQCDGGEYQLLGGWDHRYADYSPAMVAFFRHFLRDKYGSDQALRKAWHRPDVTLVTAEIPTPAERGGAEFGIFRDPARCRNVLDYSDCLNRMMAEWAISFGVIGREEAPGKLLGIYGGYVPGYKGFQLLNNGHLKFQEVYDSGLFDFFCSPHDYALRTVGMAGGNHAPIASIGLRNEFFLTENDTRTFLCTGTAWSHVRNLHETLGALKRDFVANLMLGQPMYFLDMNGGWFDNPAILDTIGMFQKIGNAALAVNDFERPQLAILYDTASIPHIREDSDPVTGPASYDLRKNLGQAGVLFDQYLLEDVVRDDFPEYRCYIIVNAFAPDAGVREAIRDKLMRDGATVIWGYGAGIFDLNDRISADSMRDLTGLTWKIEARAVPLAIQTAAGEPLGGGGEPVSPFLSIDDPGAETLAVYTTDPVPGLSRKRFSDHTAIGAPAIALTPQVWQRLLADAGIPILADGTDPVWYNGRFLAIHAASDGDKVIRVPGERNVYDLFTGEKMPLEGRELRLNLPRGKTELYFLGSDDEFAAFRQRMEGAKP